MKYFENQKEISPVPLLDSPLSSLSDMVKISEKLQQSGAEDFRSSFQRKAPSGVKEQIFNKD